MNLVFTKDQLAATAQQFWTIAQQHTIIAFHGAMGAGKTTFIHALCQAKNVISPVSSPTFSIINEYAYPEGILYHIDLYRLTDTQAAIRAGVEDCLYSGHLCLVEWPERCASLFDEKTLHLHLKTIDECTRHIFIN
jgi:tRNA threonylcarbamoyladenosine biosynthesis protein TsaE